MYKEENTEQINIHCILLKLKITSNDNEINKDLLGNIFNSAIINYITIKIFIIMYVFGFLCLRPIARDHRPCK